MDIWGLLTEFINDRLILQGTVGEIIGWVLSLLTMDDTIDTLTDGSQLKYQVPVSVVVYYKALFTNDAWNILQNSVPMNTTKLTAQDSMKCLQMCSKMPIFTFHIILNWITTHHWEINIYGLFGYKEQLFSVSWINP